MSNKKAYRYHDFKFAVEHINEDNYIILRYGKYSAVLGIDMTNDHSSYAWYLIGSPAFKYKPTTWADESGVYNGSSVGDLSARMDPFTEAIDIVCRKLLKLHNLSTTVNETVNGMESYNSAVQVVINGRPYQMESDVVSWEDMSVKLTSTAWLHRP